MADLQLLAAALTWTWVTHVSGLSLEGSSLVAVVSLSGGALLANIISVTIVVAETLMLRR